MSTDAPGHRRDRYCPLCVQLQAQSPQTRVAACGAGCTYVRTPVPAFTDYVTRRCVFAPWTEDERHEDRSFRY